MSEIIRVAGREILDSRGNPTVEVTVELDNGLQATAGVPSGASTGSHEALELRDGDQSRYGGKGVRQAVKNVNETIAPLVIGMDPSQQAKLDQAMRKADGTDNKSKLGANAILGVSLAAARAAALDRGEPLHTYLRSLGKFKPTKDAFPVPMFNVLNGGEHADSGLSIQEFKLVPRGIAGYAEQLRAGSEIFQALKSLLHKDGYSVGVGDEGGFAPRLESHAAAFETLVRAIEAAGYRPGEQVFLGVDVAANSFYDQANDRYALKPEDVQLPREQLLALYREWMAKYPLVSIEDPLHEEDWAGWRAFNEKAGERTMLIGDDLLVTNVSRLEKAIEEKACNAVLIKVNQIGTLSETFDCVRLAQKHGMKTVVSHRSGETCDDFIADLAVAAGAEYIKTGSLSRGERLSKYNRLLAIHEDVK